MAKGARALTLRALKRVGLTTAGRVEEITESLAKAESHIERLRESLDHAQQEARSLKERLRLRKEKSREHRQHAEAMRNAEEMRRRERAEKFEREAGVQVERMRENDAIRSQKLDEAQAQAAANEKLNHLGREHLMAIEVKLDIVEGAINVLDQRTRAALAAHQHHKQPG